MLIDPKYCGPSNSGNGGYVAGLFAQEITETGSPVSVMLRQPPPLGKPLSIQRDGDGVLRLMDGATLIADAATGPSYDGPLPDPVGADAAREAETRYAGASNHPFPDCYSCGPDSEHGFRLRPGPTAQTFGAGALVACTWTPTQEQTAPEFAWVALDCPGGWAGEIGEGRPAVLGRITAQVDQPLVAGRTYVVQGWKTGSSGRKSFVNTVIYGPDSSCVAVASATWITVDSESVASLNAS